MAATKGEDEIFIPAPSGFGPMFPLDLVNAGFDLTVLPFAEARDGLEVRSGTADAVVERLRRLVAAHDPKRQVALPGLPSLTDRQFGEGLWRDGLITFDDYVAFVGPGVIPPPLMAMLNTLPNDDGGDANSVTPRRVAIGLVTGAQSYEFANPLVELVREAQGWTEEHLRVRWAAWAVL